MQVLMFCKAALTSCCTLIAFTVTADCAEPAHRFKVLGDQDTQVRCLAFSPFGSHLATGGIDRMVRIYTIPDGALAAVIEMPSAVWKVDWCGADVLVCHTRFLAPNGRDQLIICSGFAKPVTKREARLDEGDLRVRDFTVLARRGLLVATVSPLQTPQDACVIVYDIESHGIARQLVTGHIEANRGSPSPDEQWRARAAPSADQLLVSGRFVGAKKESGIAVFDLDSWQRIRLLKGNGLNGEVIISSGGRLAAVALASAGHSRTKERLETCAVRLWDLHDGKVISESRPARGVIVSMSFSDDSRQFCAAFQNLERARAPGGRNVVQSGLLIWSAHTNTWDVVGFDTLSSGAGVAPKRQIELGYNNNQGWIRSAAFSPNANQLAIGFDSPARLVVKDLASQRSVIDSEIGPNYLHFGIEPVIYSPDGRHIAALVQRWQSSVIVAEAGKSNAPLLTLWTLDGNTTATQPSFNR